MLQTKLFTVNSFIIKTNDHFWSRNCFLPLFGHSTVAAVFFSRIERKELAKIYVFGVLDLLGTTVGKFRGRKAQ